MITGQGILMYLGIGLMWSLYKVFIKNTDKKMKKEVHKEIDDKYPVLRADEIKRIIDNKLVALLVLTIIFPVNMFDSIKYYLTKDK